MDTTKKKLTDTQLRIVQIILGVVSAAALAVSIFLPGVLKLPADSLLNYTFVVIFLVIMMGRRAIENKYRLRLNLFSMVLMIGLFGAIIFFIGNSLYAAEANGLTKLDGSIKILIIVGLWAVFAGLGVVFPILRYLKRKALGTLPSIRLPEPQEPAEEEAPAEDPNRPLTMEEKIAAMTNELDNNEKKDDEDQNEK